MNKKQIQAIGNVAKTLLLGGFGFILIGIAITFLMSEDSGIKLVILGGVSFFSGFAIVIIGSRKGIFPISKPNGVQ